MISKLPLISLAFVALMIAGPASTPAAPAIPRDAQTVIAAVRTAAAERDFETLRKLMLKEFTWSFGYGAEKDAQQAIDAWHKDLGALARLHRITGLHCGRIDIQYIQCPQKAGMSPRAGFKQTPLGWRMAYFVAGD